MENLIYSYDGSFEGFLTCVFESFLNKEKPCDIISVKNPQTSLFEQIKITADLEKSDRVLKSLKKKFGFEILFFIENAFLSCLNGKEILILDFIHKLYKNGAKILNDLSDNTTLTLNRAVDHLTGEAHLYKGFVRFSEHKNILFAIINPKNSILHILAVHFSQRLPKEQFLIYDETNNLICAYAKGRYTIMPITAAQIPQGHLKEDSYKILWKKFYDAVAIKERTNHKLRQNLMPKRYWKHITEMQTQKNPPIGRIGRK